MVHLLELQVPAQSVVTAVLAVQLLRVWEILITRHERREEELCAVRDTAREERVRQQVVGVLEERHPPRLTTARVVEQPPTRLLRVAPLQRGGRRAPRYVDLLSLQRRHFSRVVQGATGDVPLPQGAYVKNGMYGVTEHLFLVEP